MAEVTARKRGKYWEYRFEGANVDGKRKQFSKSGFKTKKEALEEGSKAFTEYNSSGSKFETTNISVSDYLDYWFDVDCKVNLKYNTQLSYLQIMENHIKPNFGQYKLQSVTPASITEYANKLVSSGYSKSTMVGILAVFSKALNYAVEPLNYIKQNPFQYVKHPKNERTKRERIVLDIDDWEKIMERFPKGNRYHIPMMIGFHTGMRISEVFGLTWEDIDLDKCTIDLKRQVVKRNYGVDVRQVLEKKGKKEEKSAWYFQSLKTKSSIRKIKFGETLRQELSEEKQRQEKNELEYGDYFYIHVLKKETDNDGSDIYRIMECPKALSPSFPRVHMVCIAENGNYTSTDSFKYASRIIRNEMHIKFEFHALRHTHATLLIENNANIKLVQTRLGHANIETTMNTYVHKTSTMEDDAVDIFESCLPTK